MLMLVGADQHCKYRCYVHYYYQLMMIIYVGRESKKTPSRQENKQTFCRIDDTVKECSRAVHLHCRSPLPSCRWATSDLQDYLQLFVKTGTLLSAVTLDPNIQRSQNSQACRYVALARQLLPIPDLTMEILPVVEDHKVLIIQRHSSAITAQYMPGLQALKAKRVHAANLTVSHATTWAEANLGALSYLSQRGRWHMYGSVHNSV